MRKHHIVWIYGLFAILVLYLVEHQWMCNYMVKTMIKIPMFTLFPWLLAKRYLAKEGGGRARLQHWIYVLVGICIVVISIIIAYFAMASFIDIEVIKTDFIQRLDISREQLIGIALYTTLVNAFIEEFFFRGFIYLNLKHSGYRSYGYFVSALIFALYHVTIFMTWFSLPLMVVALIGLFIGGLIFAWFADQTDSLMGSWLVHVAADASIMFIAFFFLKILD